MAVAENTSLVARLAFCVVKLHKAQHSFKGGVRFAVYFDIGGDKKIEARTLLAKTGLGLLLLLDALFSSYAESVRAK